ncbi:hypothetical protein BN424_213 [Carnobacterium maltaromaticum LMA28]|uniref:Uncharacterized protein n=1 Tax=Carnobacterium maltaromaticum LMA28 TaxID=1234679 RepID=K8EMI0_CARML|nr:hypothetical protein BN424_213 [Carnobacterium maltaromaticum LMA28]
MNHCNKTIEKGSENLSPERFSIRPDKSTQGFKVDLSGLFIFL